MQPITLEIKERMSNVDFTELGFRVHQKYFHSGIFAQFVQGDFVFLIEEKKYIMRVLGAKAYFLTDGSINAENIRLEVHIKSEETWIKIAQRKLHPLRALLNGSIRIRKGGIQDFILYWRCFTIPYRNTKELVHEAPIKASPSIEKIKRVVVFNASPRDHGATRFFLEPFVGGMEDAGAEVSVIPVYKKNITPCRGCFTCFFVTPGKCIYQDDMIQLIPAVENCDLWVLAFPTYVGNIPSGLQRMLERFITFLRPQYVIGLDGLTHHHRRNKRHAQYLVGLNVYGLLEKKQSAHLDDSLKDIAGHLQFDYLGLTRISNSMEKAINKQDEKALDKDLSLLREIGKKLVINKKLDRRLSRKLNTGSPFTIAEMLHINNSFHELVREQNVAKINSEEARRTFLRESVL